MACSSGTKRALLTLCPGGSKWCQRGVSKVWEAKLRARSCWYFPAQMVWFGSAVGLQKWVLGNNFVTVLGRKDTTCTPPPVVPSQIFPCRSTHLAMLLGCGREVATGNCPDCSWFWRFDNEVVSKTWLW